MPVIFTGDTSAIDVSTDNKTLIVTHEMYAPPKVKGVHVPWQQYRVLYGQYECDSLILVGVNRMITPQNRCDMVNDYIQTLSSNITKTVVDVCPFLGEPWRLWYHFSIAFGSWLGLTYSYPVEGDWQKWFYREQNDSKLSGENIRLYIKDTKSDIPALHTRFSLDSVNDTDLAWYDEAKKHVFDTYNTPKLIINHLLKLANQRYQLKIDFDSFRTNDVFKLPDIGIYRFMQEENERRMNTYNQFTREALHQ